jgi:hypothetical protein
MRKEIYLRAAYGLIVFALSASLTPIHAQSFTQRVLDVSDNGRSLATVTLERNAEVLKLYIDRNGEPVHSYGNFPTVAASSIYIGKKKVLAYYATSNRVETETSDFTGSAAGRRGRKDAGELHNLLADDMRILRAIRSYDRSIASFESIFVIATGDESIFQGEPAASLQVKERASEGATSKVGFSARLIKSSLTMRPCRTRQGPSPGTIEYCYQQCDNNRDMCAHDSKVPDHTVCYSGYYSCVGNCDSVYGGGTKPPTKQPILDASFTVSDHH